MSETEKLARRLNREAAEKERASARRHRDAKRESQRRSDEERAYSASFAGGDN